MERYNSPAAGMSEQHRTVQQGMESIEQGQQSIAQAIQSPVKQAIDLQKDMAQILMSGLELTESTQRIGLDMTRSLSQSYLKAMEDTMKGLSQATQDGASMQGGSQQRRQPPNGREQFQQMGPVGQPPQAPPAPAAQPPPTHDYQQQFQPQPQPQPQFQYEQGAPQENQMPQQQYQNQPTE